MIEYIKLFWEDAPEGEPPVILYEVDTENERLALRSIDIFADGRARNIPDLYDGAIEITPIPTEMCIRDSAYFRDMSGCELAEVEQAAGEKCQPIGHIGYYYPAEVWISEYGKLYAKYEYQDEIECFPDVFALIERELRQCKFDSAAMKTVEALDGKR